MFSITSATKEAGLLVGTAVEKTTEVTRGLPERARQAASKTRARVPKIAATIGSGLRQVRDEFVAGYREGRAGCDFDPETGEVKDVYAH